MKFHLCLLSSLFAVGLLAQTDGKNYTTYPAGEPFKNVDVITAASIFGLAVDHQLRKQYEISGSDDRLHVKYHQYYQDLRVMGGTVVYHVNDGSLYATTGRLSRLEGTDLTTRISRAQGERLARLRAGMELLAGHGGSFVRPSQLKLTDIDLVIINQHFPVRGGDHFPAYVYNFTAGGGRGFPVDLDVIVNARNGRVVVAVSNIHAEATVGTGDGLYNRNITFPVDSLAPDHYELYDESRGQGIFAYDLSNFETVPRDEDNHWSSDREGDAAMLNGYHASVKFHDFLAERFNRNSIDDEGFPLVANMNRHSFVNAFWNGREATFGNGDCNRYGPLTTFEIVAHEYAHGLTDFTSDLIYLNESGAINESISDIMAKGFEWYYDNENFNWLIGSAVRRDPDQRFFRSFVDPGERFHPKFYRGENWRTSSRDAGGVHSNSGVLNHWFYLVVEGKKGLNEAGEAFDVAPIGMDSALQLVYLLETAFLTETSGYEDCHDYSLTAAEELFGAGSRPYLSITEAWKAVGLPYVSDDEDETLTIDVNYGPENSTHADLCPAELSNMIGDVRNRNFSTIPEGTMVSGRVIYFFSVDGEETRDTVDINPQRIPEDVMYNQTFELRLSYHRTQVPERISTVNELVFNTPGGQMYTATDQDFILINNTPAIEVERYVVEVNEICGTIPELEQELITLAFPRCGGPFTGSVRFEYTNGNDSLFHDYGLTNFERSTRSFFATFARIDLDFLGDLRKVKLHIKTIRGDETYTVQEIDFANYFATEISAPTMYAFDDLELARQDLAISVCEECSFDYDGEKLNIVSTDSSPEEVDDCVPQDDFLRSAAEDGEHVSTVQLCIDATDIANPHLVFTLKHRDAPDRDQLTNSYLHIADVYAGTMALLDEPISTTRGRTSSFEIPLPAGYTGDLQIYLLNIGTSSTIDDIGIASGAPSPTRRLTAGSFVFTYANPVNEMLELRTNLPLPDNSTVSVISADGRLVSTQPVYNRYASLDLAAQPAGLYFLTVTDGSTFRWMGKVVKR